MRETSQGGEVVCPWASTAATTRAYNRARKWLSTGKHSESPSEVSRVAKLQRARGEGSESTTSLLGPEFLASGKQGMVMG